MKKVSRLTFSTLFVLFAFAFIILTSLLLGQAPEAIGGSALQAWWQSTISTILSPVKVVLIGPLLPFIDFLRQDPDTPPPFFLAGFIIYWTILANMIYFLLSKKSIIRSSRQG
jgi:hypothetical protein